MTAPLDSWEREQFVEGGGDALILIAVYGLFRLGAQISASTYRTQGVPEGITLSKLDRATRPEFPFTDAAFRKTTGEERPECLPQGFHRRRHVPPRPWGHGGHGSAGPEALRPILVAGRALRALPAGSLEACRDPRFRGTGDVAEVHRPSSQGRSDPRRTGNQDGRTASGPDLPSCREQGRPGLQ